MTESQARRLGTLIAKARIGKGLSTRELASRLGVAKGWVSGIESGRFLDTAPGRLARLCEVLDIEPARIDRITKGTVADSLPEVRTYFRAKYGLTPEQAERIERYVERYVDPPEERAA
jgi:transcriptional regulator with XRE-family HTH domain